MKISFKSKLILSYSMVVLLSFGAVGFFLDRSLEKRSLQNIESSLVAQAHLIGDRITADSLKEEYSDRLESMAKILGLKAGCRITVISSSGKVLADSDESMAEISHMDNHIGRPEIRTALIGGIGVNSRYSPTLKMDMLYVALPIKDSGVIAGVLRLALPLESVTKTLGDIRNIILCGLLFAITLAIGIGYLLASQAIGPINRMVHISRKFSRGDFDRRIIQAPPDEIGELADTMNNMAQDIEDKIREVKTQNQHLAAIFNSMIEGVIVVDRAGRIISVNTTIEKIFNVVKKDVEGRLFLEAIRNNDIADFVSGVLRKGEALAGEIALVYPVRRIFQVNATPIFDGKNVNGCLLVIHDISEIRRLETVRSDFVANVSHELKTPLTSIKGFVETLLEGALEDDDNRKQFLEIIKDHTDRLDKLVSDLLALSHLESKAITMERKVFDVHRQIEEILLGFRTQLKKSRVEVENEVPSGLCVSADKNRIDQVITNLIDNAIKFNKEKGLIRIRGEDAGGAIKIVIEDSGAGIPVKDMPRIFERFYRVDKARSRELGGTGLGLSIVKHIVELHGGAVGVESAEGVGSKFWFTLPK